MPFKQLLTYLLIILPFGKLFAQSGQVVSLSSPRQEMKALPGQVVNLAFFIKNTTDSDRVISTLVQTPENWKLISSLQELELTPFEKKFIICSIQIPSKCPAGEFEVIFSAEDYSARKVLDSQKIKIQLGEVEKIELFSIKSPGYIWAGQEATSEFLLQNLGNVEKKVYLESINCHIQGLSEITIDPGESYRFEAVHKPSAELTETTKDYYTVRALISGEVTKSIFQWVQVFPVKEKKTDLYRRFPVTASATYLASNQRGRYEHAWQLEFSGSGFVDQKGKHKIDFLARGPNNTELSFLGMYDQYFISYQHDNLDLTVGEKAYTFTPLTESSRFGLGAESRIKMNSGFNVGLLYVKPRFYENIKYEMAAFAGFEFNRQNNVEVYFISKRMEFHPDEAQMISLNSRFQPLKKTSAEVEVSSGRFMNAWDHAVRGNLNSQFSVFSLAGSYYNAGKNYPGYYSNSTFYSGNASVQLSQKINIGFYAREDFRNAQLDTFFVTAPYSSSLQSMFNYNIAPRTNLRVFWRKYERKDRLVYDKFHYQTNSLNTHFNQHIRKLEYNLLAEFGETTNFLLVPEENRQTMYRGTLNLAYRFNDLHAVRLMGSYSNANSFISGEQNNFIAGVSLVNNIAKNLRTYLHLQNAYNIEEYYRNRNLLQFNFDFTPNKMHKFSLRSFYTLFRHKTSNPQLTFSFNYSLNFGIPLQKIVKAGDLTGHITRENGEPADGIILTLTNKTTITDKNGKFSFKTIPAGRHFLFIDQSNLDIDEILQTTNPAEIEIIENRMETFNFRILKGAKVSGAFAIEQSSERIPGKEQTNAEHIVVELKGNLESYRIKSNNNGSFSFPIVRPGEYTFKVYTNSIPEGYEIEEPEIPLHLQSGQQRQLQIKLKQKERNIIFKPNQNILKPLGQLNNKSDTGLTSKKPVKKCNDAKEFYYSVQIGAFRKKPSTDSGYFKDKAYDFEIESSNYYKYFIGKFPSLKEAEEEQKRLEEIYRNPFIVKFKNGQIIHNEPKNK